MGYRNCEICHQLIGDCRCTWDPSTGTTKQGKRIEALAPGVVLQLLMSGEL